MNYIVKELCGLNEDQFYSIYNTNVLRDLKIKNLSEFIVKNAPEELYEKCYFEQKRVLFASVWPDYYNEKFKSITPHDLYYCKGDLKNGLMRAAASKYDSVHTGEDMKEVVKKDGTFKKKYSGSAKTVYGRCIDKIAYDCITTVLENEGCIDFYDKLNFIANYKSLCKVKDKDTPGIFQVIKKRDCYESVLDFYMLNSPTELQIAYVDDYMEIRNQHQKQNPILNLFYQAFQEEMGYTADFEFDDEEIDTEEERDIHKDELAFDNPEYQKSDDYKEIEEDLGNVISLSDMDEFQ